MFIIPHDAVNMSKQLYDGLKTTGTPIWYLSGNGTFKKQVLLPLYMRNDLQNRIVVANFAGGISEFHLAMQHIYDSELFLKGSFVEPSAEPSAEPIITRYEQSAMIMPCDHVKNLLDNCKVFGFGEIVGGGVSVSVRVCDEVPDDVYERYITLSHTTATPEDWKKIADTGKPIVHLQVDELDSEISEIFPSDRTVVKQVNTTGVNLREVILNLLQENHDHKMYLYPKNNITLDDFYITENKLPRNPVLSAKFESAEQRKEFMESYARSMGCSGTSLKDCLRVWFLCYMLTVKSSNSRTDCTELVKDVININDYTEIPGLIVRVHRFCDPQ